MTTLPQVTVIIPHYNGEDILRRCLLSLYEIQTVPIHVLIVDNGSTDGSLDRVRTEFPKIEIIEAGKNLGYSGGCNLGIQHAETPYLFLLNNDAKVKSDWITEMLSILESDPNIAAVQPKVLSIQDPERFDYCGAAGGEIDVYGYPFARGRMFQEMEVDQGQYDQCEDIFWATGAAMLIRKSALEKTGVLEEAFFAHMEEIDLCWRFHLAGYRVCSAPRAIVYHQTGGTLGQESLRKMVLNHRNSLLMILRNYRKRTLCRILPIRLFLETLTFCSSLMQGQWKRALAVPAGLFGALRHIETIRTGRIKVRQIRIIEDHQIMQVMYPKSVALAFFLHRKKRFSDLRFNPIK